MDELVSVIILTWNRAELLKETLASVLGQTYQNIEVLIVDNESTDETRAYIEGLDDRRVKYLRHPNNGILSVNRNFGISQARGGYIAFCDDDDLWLPHKLEKQMEVVSGHPECKVVCSNGIYFDEKGDIGCLISREGDAELTLNDFLKGRSDVVLPSVLINKDVFTVVGTYNEDPRIVNTEDFEFMVRVATKYPIYFLGESLVKYRIHNVMTSHANTLKTIAKEKLFFCALYDRQVLGGGEYATVKKNLRKKYIIAFFKELLKRSVTIKTAVYSLRRVRLKSRAADGGPSSFKDR